VIYRWLKKNKAVPEEFFVRRMTRSRHVFDALRLAVEKTPTPTPVP
jgi:hypothetical protein